MAQHYDPLNSAVEATMRMFDRYGGLWSNDHDHIRYQLTVIISAAMDLGSDYAEGWDRADATLASMMTTDAVRPKPDPTHPDSVAASEAAQERFADQA